MSEGDGTVPLSERPSGPRAAAPVRPTYAVDDVLADRYRIVRFLALGGMGEVYEVYDLELRQTVALKTIRPEIAANATTTERFKREINLARQVTHANVSRIFDLGKHVRADGGEVTFLTMEMIQGEPLSARIRSAGKLTIDEALPILRQIGMAIDAAHAKGIVHRDLKPGNILLAPDTGEHSLRAIVTDFGIAHVAGADEGLLTGTGDIVGSPAYMSPEQVEGAEITARSDLYSLGLLAYELVTGTRPFEGETALSTAAKRLKLDPKPPQVHVHDLPDRWNKSILRMLERAPAARFPSAADFVAALAGGRPRSRVRIALAVVAVLATLLAAWAIGSRGTDRSAATSSPVAVLGFKNLAGRAESAWLSTAIAEMLRTELAVGDSVRVVAGEVVARAKVDLALADELSHSRDTLARIRTSLGADYVVTGSYLIGGDNQLRLDVRLEDTVAGEVIASVAETGSEARLFELVESVGARLRQRLGAPVLTASQAGSVRASLPANPEAARLYADGLSQLRTGNAQGARDLLVRAAAIDAHHPMIRAALSSVWTALGYDAKARTEAELAYQRTGELSPYEQRLIEARYRETRHEWDAAIAIYSGLVRDQPDNLERGLRLVAAQIDAGRGTEALATIEQLRTLPPPAPTDPSLDLYESRAALYIGDKPRILAAALRGIEHADARGARKLAIEAWIYRANGEWALGRYPAATASVEHALDLLRDFTDELQRARALATLANIMAESGDKPAAHALNDEALSVMREIGNQNGISVVLNNLATDLAEEGDLEGAGTRLTEALAVAREIGDPSLQSMVELNLGELARERGDLVEANRLLDGVIAGTQTRGDREWYAQGLHLRAEARLAAGELAEAKQGFESALELERELELEGAMAFTLCALGRVAAAHDDGVAAIARYDEAIALQTKIGRRWDRALTVIWRATQLIESGRAGEAAAALAEVTAELDANAKEIASFAHAVQAWALASSGHPGDVDREVARAPELPAHITTRFAASLAIARARAGAGGRVVDAVKSFEAIRAEAERHGFRGVALAAELEVLLRSHDRAGLDAFAVRARALGFIELARRAAR